MLVSVGILPPHAKLQTPAFLKHTMQYKRKLMERAAFLEACYLGSQMILFQNQAGQAAEKETNSIMNMHFLQRCIPSLALSERSSRGSEGKCCVAMGT